MTVSFGTFESIRDFFAQQMKQNVLDHPEGFPESFYEETGEFYHTTTVEIVDELRPLGNLLTEIDGTDLEWMMEDLYDWFESTSNEARELVKQNENALDEFITERVALSEFQAFADLY